MYCAKDGQTEAGVEGCGVDGGKAEARGVAGSYRH